MFNRIQSLNKLKERIEPTYEEFNNKRLNSYQHLTPNVDSENHSLREKMSQFQTAQDAQFDLETEAEIK